ncbi:MAG: hypothetical protein ACKO6C_06065 [Alphaproteobacteria bacterium]
MIHINQKIKISDLAKEVLNLDDEHLHSFARILYVAGYEDGVIKEAKNFDESCKSQILEKEVTAEKFNALLQENLFQKFRPNGLERQDIKSKIHDEDNEIILEDFRKIGFQDNVTPQEKKFGEALIFGATITGMKARLDSLIVQSDIEFEKLTILAGARDLWLDSPLDNPIAKQLLIQRCDKSEVNFDSIDAKIAEFKAQEGISVNDLRKKLVGYYTTQYRISFPTETDGARALLENYQKQGKIADGVLIYVVDAKKKPDGSRPDSEDTIKKWLEDNKNFQGNDLERGGEEKDKVKILFVSNQPHYNAQKTAMGIHCHGVPISVSGLASASINKDSAILFPELAGGFNRFAKLLKALQPATNISNAKVGDISEKGLGNVI